MKPTPVRDGFRATWRQPSLVLAEIAWRWSFGSAALILSSLAVLEFFRTLIVTPGDIFLLRTGQPFLIGRALADIFAGSGFRFFSAMTLLATMLAILWIFAGALGRKATLLGLWDRLAPEIEIGRRSLRPLLGLHFLRAALLMVSVIAIFGAGVAASLVSTPQHPHHTLPALIFIPLAMVVIALAAALQWFLALASLLAVRDGTDTFASINAALDLCRRRFAALLASSFWFLLLHITVFTMATTAVGFPLSLTPLLPVGVALVLIAGITLLYFAVVDSLYIARLGGYLSILEFDRRPPEPEPPVALAPPPPPVPGPPAPEFPPDDDILCEILARQAREQDKSF